MERSSKKIPVTEREFLWVQDDDKGEVVLHVGPTMVSPTAADRVVADDGDGGFHENNANRPQKMIVVGDDQYCVLYNPLVDNDGSGNGKFRQGRNEARPLKNGTRAMIPGPCSFYLWPGQRSEVRDAHELGSNQYLIVKVYGEVDKTAPYYQITGKSAGIKTAIAEEIDRNATEGGEDAPVVEIDDEITFSRGQLLVIRGIDTQFYIPPTGVDIVPDTSIDATGGAISAEMARHLLKELPTEGAGILAAQEVEQLLSELDDAPPPLQSANKSRRKKPKEAVIDRSPRMRQQSQMQMVEPLDVQAEMPAEASVEEQLQQRIAGSPLLRSAFERMARKERLVRDAVVLGEKEFCIILDADGKRQVKVGPARVFPGPYDTFSTAGSRNRIYDAYELLPHRAIWLRMLVPMAKNDLATHLPAGVPLDKDKFQPGDELLLSGISAFFFPFNEIEVLSPETGQAVLGNDHNQVFIEALGIDQKSGIYVRDLATGEVKLVRGKQSYLVDPRREVHITRTVPPDEWNLWIAQQEPHKNTRLHITTPWALSIGIPHNHAVLATSADGQRVVEGPCVALLSYEEKLAVLTLSTGRPKSDDRVVRTCFLRTSGNRISDTIRIETKDFVTVDLEVRYNVAFDKESPERWFTHDNYVQMLVEHLRSLVRSRARTLSLMDVWPSIAQTLRDTILGPKPAEGPRPGRDFPESGMRVNEVEVLNSEILDPEIATLMQGMQTQSVALQIGDREAQEQLRSAELRAAVDRKKLELTQTQKELEAQYQETIEQLTHNSGLLTIKHREELTQLQEQLSSSRQLTSIQARVAQNATSQQAAMKLVLEEAQTKANANKAVHDEELAYQAALREIQTKLLQAQAQAVVAQHQAVQPGVVEAMTALGDKIMLAEVAENMNLISLFQGKDVGTILSEVLGGTSVIPTVEMLRESYPAGGKKKKKGEE